MLKSGKLAKGIGIALLFVTVASSVCVRTANAGNQTIPLPNYYQTIKAPTAEQQAHAQGKVEIDESTRETIRGRKPDGDDLLASKVSGTLTKPDGEKIAFAVTTIVKDPPLHAHARAVFINPKNPKEKLLIWSPSFDTIYFGFEKENPIAYMMNPKHQEWKFLVPKEAQNLPLKDQAYATYHFLIGIGLHWVEQKAVASIGARWEQKPQDAQTVRRITLFKSNAPADHKPLTPAVEGTFKIGERMLNLLIAADEKGYVLYARNPQTEIPLTRLPKNEAGETILPEKILVAYRGMDFAMTPEEKADLNKALTTLGQHITKIPTLEALAKEQAKKIQAAEKAEAPKETPKAEAPKGEVPKAETPKSTDSSTVSPAPVAPSSQGSSTAKPSGTETTRGGMTYGQFAIHDKDRYDSKTGTFLKEAPSEDKGWLTNLFAKAGEQVAKAFHFFENKPNTPPPAPKASVRGPRP